MVKEEEIDENLGTIGEKGKAPEETEEEPEQESQAQDKESRSQKTKEEPKGDKVFISEEELKALEQKVKNAPKDQKEVYEKAVADVRASIEEARERQASKQEQKQLKSELETLKQELISIKEQANKPQRRGISHTPQKLVQQDSEGRKGYDRAELERMTREVLFPNK